MACEQRADAEDIEGVCDDAASALLGEAAAPVRRAQVEAELEDVACGVAWLEAAAAGLERVAGDRDRPVRDRVVALVGELGGEASADRVVVEGATDEPRDRGVAEHCAGERQIVVAPG